MSKRRYFDCPIQVLYMMKEFGVNFECRHTDEEMKEYDLEEKDRFYPFEDAGIEVQDFGPLSDVISELNNLRRIYVCKESEAIFEPKHGDLNQDGDMFNSDIRCSDPRGAWEEMGQNDSHKHDDRFDEIIYRKEKQFFQGEVVND